MTYEGLGMTWRGYFQVKIIFNFLILSLIFINDAFAERIITSEDVQTNLDIVLLLSRI